MLELSGDEYVDSRRDVRTPDYVHLEHVRKGQAVFTLAVRKEAALRIAYDWAANLGGKYEYQRMA